MAEYKGRHIVKHEKKNGITVETYVEFEEGQVYLNTYVNFKLYSRIHVADLASKDIAADVAPVKHGHIVWKEYHKGGIRRRKCLQEIKSVYIEQQMPCKHIAITDERYLSKDPYCSECGMLLGEFLNYCGNCGAKMDGGENNGT